MLQLNDGLYHEGGDGGRQPLKPGLTLSHLVAMARRQWPWIAGGVIVGLVLAAGYVATAPSRYTASVKIMIDTRKNNLLRKNEIVTDYQPDAGFVESQVEVLKSESVGHTVIKNLDLTKDPEFVGNGRTSLVSSLMASLMAMLRTGDEDEEAGLSSEDRLERAALATLANNIAVKRVGLTFVLQVDYTARSPEKAARIANSIADAYMVGELEAKYQSTRRASLWLRDRISELRKQASASDQAVQAFKAENNIVDTSRGLMSEQQLTDVNSQLIQARAATAEAKARLERIREISAGDLPDATVADALRNDVINRSRAQYLDIARREADWSARYGANHAAAVNLRVQMAELKRAILDEVRRIAQTYESDYQIALARERSLDASLASLVQQAGTTSQAQVKLRELESSSQTYRNLYDSFLQKFEEATQQQTFPVTEARVITPAVEPVGRSSPKTMLIMPGGLLAGLALGMLIAMARELTSNTFRFPTDVQEIGLECVGTLPTIPVGRGKGDSTREFAFQQIRRHAVEEPFSRFAEELRNVKVTLDVVRLTRDVKVVGLVSALPKEGKTSVSSNLAHLTAQSGHRVLLIDGDLRNPMLTRVGAGEAGGGLIEVLQGVTPLRDALIRDPVSGLDFLPAVVPDRMAHTAELISSDSMARLLNEARDLYDYVFVDLPPLLSIVDTKAAARLIDGFLFVIAWGATSRQAVVEALTGAQLVAERTIGVVLNNADPAALKRIEYYKGRYYQSYYQKEAA